MSSPPPSTSPESMSKPHVVLLSFPAQGHITPILALAKLLHSRASFRITVVNTEFNHRRLLRSYSGAAAAASFDAIDGFQLASIPDGLTTPADSDSTQDIPSLCLSTRQHCPAFFHRFLSTLSPPATCVIADGSMNSTATAALELGIPLWLFYTHSACGFWSYVHFPDLFCRGYSPLKDQSFLTNGYFDTPIHFIPGMEGIRLTDMPSFVRTTDAADTMLQIMLKRAEDAAKGVGLILNTFDALEPPVLAAIRSKFANLYTIGPLAQLQRQVTAGSEAAMIGSSLLKTNAECLYWLNLQEQRRVVYVNFGSITVVSEQQLQEFAWGLAGSGYPVLWAIRPDMVHSAALSIVLEGGFAKEMQGRAMVVTWCDQEAVLGHPATGLFLTHCGWNSTLESLVEGVPMVCWPFFAEQPTNCRYVCKEWGLGLEIEGEVKRERVEKLVRDAMEGEKGVEMRRRALEWKERAKRAIEPGGSSFSNLEKLIRDLAEASK